MISNLHDVEEIRAIVDRQGQQHLLLLVGLDGVLVPYQGDPHAVRLREDQCETLKKFAERPGVTLGLVSGRRVRELRQCASVGERAFYIGLHGLEIEGPGFAFSEWPMLDLHRGRVREIATTLHRSMSSVAGVQIENKDAAIAVHTREAGPGDAVWARMHFLNVAVSVIRPQELQLIRGNHVIELVPNVPHPRASAIAGICRHLEKREGVQIFPVYVGEDVADDDAFGAIEGHGVTAAVGSRAPKAQFHLDSPGDVWQLVERLAEQRQRRSRGSKEGRDGG
jgi:trehalose-phosphatase